MPEKNNNTDRKYQVGDKVILNGYCGRIIAILGGQLEGMVEVRLPGGDACVDIQELGK